MRYRTYVTHSMARVDPSEVQVALNQPRSPEELEQAEKAIDRMRQKPKISGTQEQLIHLYAAVRSLHPDLPSKRITPEMLTSLARKVTLSLERSTSFYVLEKNSPFLANVPPEAYVDLSSIIIPPGMDISNSVILWRTMVNPSLLGRVRRR